VDDGDVVGHATMAAGGSRSPFHQGIDEGGGRQ
jgi:hypothetical protein